MKRFRLIVACALAALLLTVPGSASAANRYLTYVGCGTGASTQPATSCSRNSRKAAFFKSRDASATHKVCVKFPGGNKLCANNQSAPQGSLRINTITSTQKGRHTVRWFVGGTKIATRYLQVT